MTRALLILAIALVNFTGCNHETPTECPAPASAVATCAEACDHIIALGCSVAANTSECQSICQQSTVNVPDGARVLGCYAVATSCDGVDDCSQTCGPGNTQVVFYLDAGVSLDAESEASM